MSGGPLAVNAFGSADRSAGFVGGHVGYQWAEILTNSSLRLSPAVELEGYYLGKSSFQSHDINDNTNRIQEHDFLTTLPTSTGVFLINGILNFNPSQGKLHPYLGAGIGGAILSVSNASAIQVSPPEVGVNHFNSNTGDKQSTFAAQGKAGLNYDISDNASIFIEYRYLYLAGTDFTFGSTVYPGHAATSPWQVNIDSQGYNMGAIDLHYYI